MRAVAVAIALVVLGVVSASAPPVAPAARTASCAGAISWSQAKAYIGRVKTVRGRVAGAFYASSSNGSPTFLNLGAGYPSPRRFTVVIWGTGPPSLRRTGAALRAPHDLRLRSDSIV